MGQPQINSVQLPDNCSQIKFILLNVTGQVQAYYGVDILPILINQAIIPLEPQYNYQVLLINSVEKICGSHNSLELPDWVVNVANSQGGLTGVIYKYRTLEKEEYQALNVANLQNHPAVYGFAKCQLSDGNFNLAKYALKSSGNLTLCDRHLRALSNTELLTLVYDLELVLFHPEQLANHLIRPLNWSGNCSENSPENSKISVCEVMEFLSDYRQYILLNLQHLQTDYERTGIKRVVRHDENQQKPWLDTEYIDSLDTNPYLRMGKIEYNRHDATMNLLVKRRIRLVKSADNTPIQEIAGVFLDNLHQFNSYTIVRDGQLNVKTLRIKIGNKAVFEWLRDYNLITEKNFNFAQEYTISLVNLPLVNWQRKYIIPNGIFEQILVVKVLMGMLKACLKQESPIWIPEQTQQLRNHYLSPNLYLNIPKQPETKSRMSALVVGNVTLRKRYKIELGNRLILHLGKLKSANRFFAQRYQVYDRETGEILANHHLGMLWQKNLGFRHKQLNSRCRNTPIDIFIEAIFDEFLGLTPPQILTQVLDNIGASSFAYISPAKYNEEGRKKTEMVAALTAAYTNLEEYIEGAYHKWISPFVFYIGATGFLPNSLSSALNCLTNQRVMNSEELGIKYPNLQISRNENDGLFFETGNYILSIYPKTEYYSK